MTLKKKVNAAIAKYGAKMRQAGRLWSAREGCHTDGQRQYLTGMKLTREAHAELNALLEPVLAEYEPMKKRLAQLEQVLIQVDGVLIANRITAVDGDYRTALENLIADVRCAEQLAPIYMPLPDPNATVHPHQKGRWGEVAGRCV